MLSWFNQSHQIIQLYANQIKYVCVYFVKRAAIGWAVFAQQAVYFLVLSVTKSKPPRMMSSPANCRPFFSSFRHIPPQERFVKLAN